MRKESSELVTKMLDSCLAFEENFQKPSGGEAAEEAPIDTWKSDKKKIIREIADIVSDLNGGIHNDALEGIKVEEHTSPLSIDWGQGEVIPPCANIARSIRVSASAISSTAAETAPPVPPRALCRVMSDPIYADAKRADVEKERQEIWNTSTAERKKYVSFSTCKTWAKTELVKHVTQLKAAQAFEPRIGEHHRVFFASADFHRARSK